MVYKRRLKPNGKIEQWRIEDTHASGIYTFSFYVSFSNTNYVPSVTEGESENGTMPVPFYTNKNMNSIDWGFYAAGNYKRKGCIFIIGY